MHDLLDSPRFRFVLDYFRTLDFTNRDVYANWLAQTYYFVSHSVRLSALGASRLDVDHPLSQRMVAHTREEAGHHKLAKRDIEALGRRLEDFPQLGVTSAFYQAQYYVVLFEDPAHLIGQILMLEAVSVELGAWMHDLVHARHGEAASRFVKVHAQEDQDHVRKAIAAVNELPPAQQAGVARNFSQACEMYFLILRSIRESTDSLTTAPLLAATEAASLEIAS
ncbi:MAG TPA: iron-containing redox enzyme family protein [Thermoanaerobaculia bacterium]